MAAQAIEVVEAGLQRLDAVIDEAVGFLEAFAAHEHLAVALAHGFADGL